MDGDDAMADALMNAFATIVKVTPPGRIVPVLRHALTTLLAEEPAPASPSGHRPATRWQRNRWTGNLETWAPLRERILLVLAARGMSRRELAAAVKINHATLKPALLPRGRSPGRANLLRLEDWLKSMEPRTRSGVGAGDDSHPSVEAVVSPPAYRLTTAQREKLAAYRQLDNKRRETKPGSRWRSSTRPSPAIRSRQKSSADWSTSFSSNSP